VAAAVGATGGQLGGAPLVGVAVGTRVRVAVAAGTRVRVAVGPGPLRIMGR
jgi:hypothetical protein